VVPPCVNKSDAAFSARDGKIYYAIGAVKGVGQAVAEHIVEARGNQPFADLADFATRVDPRIINRRTLETLVNAGAFDSLVSRREQALAAIDAVLGTAQRLATDKSAGIVDMFASEKPEPIILPESFEPWPLAERLEREFSAIGFHLSAHPLDAYSDLFDRLRVQKWGDFERAVKEGHRAGRIAGTVSSRQDRRTKKGTPMAILNFSDQSGGYECIAFSEQIAQYSAVLETGRSLILEVEADERPDGIGLRLIKAESIDGATERLGRSLTVFPASEAVLPAIKAQLKPGGEGAVTMIVSRDGGAREYEIKLPGGFKLTAEVAGGIKALAGVTDVRLN
jgi:DNA polymerase-3 subunit alpha